MRETWDVKRNSDKTPNRNESHSNASVRGCASINRGGPPMYDHRIVCTALINPRESVDVALRNRFLSA